MGRASTSRWHACACWAADSVEEPRICRPNPVPLLPAPPLLPRVGMTGVSLGGMHTFLAAAADERVAAAAPMIGVQGFRQGAELLAEISYES